MPFKRDNKEFNRSTAPFIFANWNNTSADVDVLTHECGHAFEGYVAERDPKIPADLECPGLESAEIHSMAMEFLTAPSVSYTHRADGRVRHTHHDVSAVIDGDEHPRCTALADRRRHGRGDLAQQRIGDDDADGADDDVRPAARCV